jgi:N-acetylated-alpha-linked acidic dipeptidase
MRFSDSSAGGSQFRIEASPSLADVARDVASVIHHPTDANRTLWDMRNDDGPYRGSVALNVQEFFDQPRASVSKTEVGALGSGSDYTVRFAYQFCRHALILKTSGVLAVSRGKHSVQQGGVWGDLDSDPQIASVDQGSGHGKYDAAYHYHSIYDSHHWMATYGDRGFHGHVALAKHIGLLGLKIVDSIILPINTTRYCEDLFGYIEK